MGLIVQKYGGSSVADAQKIRGVARRVVETTKAGHGTVVVERPKVGGAVALPDGWGIEKERAYGDTLLVVAHAG